MQFQFNLRGFYSKFKRQILFALLVIFILHFIPNGRHEMSLFPQGIELDPIINDIQYAQMGRYSRDIHSISLQRKCHDYFKTLDQTDLDFNPKLGDSYNHENVDMIKHIKSVVIYNSCFVDNEIPLLDKLEEKIYPFLSFQYPNFEHWDGEVYEITKPKKGQSFLVNFKNQFKGDGIVVSISDDFVDEVIQLITMLRTLGNELPIQLMYRNDLSLKNKQRIVEAARGDYQPTAKKSKVLNYKFYSETRPMQDIWFVNIYPSISTPYRDAFQKYFQKELAYLFTTFQNMILMDTDIIMFKPPIELLKSKPFIKTGTLFFKDRNTKMRMSDRYVTFIKETAPTPFDSILFGLRQSNLLSNEYLNERYFHYQESGVVVVNRLHHFSSVLLTPQLSQFQSTFIASWGDKEHFFLSFLLGGDQSFEFNSHWAGAIGTELEDTLEGPRLCSTHPAHFDQEDNSLIWMNSGYKFCPLDATEYSEDDLEFWEARGAVASFKEMSEMYSRPVDIQIGLIPPVEAGGNEQLPICGQRTWCSYQKVDKALGVLVNFSTSETEWFQYVLNSIYLR